ncbi:hypothetical protein B0H16DRAFT_1770586 [Mycena metata]|uniref:Uncharacterized protein n=1 Tax=Mycena metata TaxID=1033252 RepID=A0AAD7I1P6_9AGAR|nr:hypothetical protein B0H16DRAFT_1770586 [Mycena metata]
MPHSQDLLALLSILPDGLSDVELKQGKFPIKDILGCKTALLRTALAYTDDHKRLKVLVPVREYMGRCYPPTEPIIRPLLAHFHELLELYVTVFGKESGAFPIARITSNYTNIQNVLRCGLQPEHPDMAKSIYCTCDFNSFTRHLGHATLLMKDINPILPSLHDHRLKTYFIIELFNSFYYNPISEPETLIAQALDHLKHLDDPDLESRFHRALGVYYSQQKHDMTKAVKHAQTALFLAQSNGNYGGQCIALEGLSRLEWFRGQYTAGQAYAKEEQKVARISGNLFQEATGLCYESFCMQTLGHYKHCNSMLTRARTLLRLCGMSYGGRDYDVMCTQAEVHKNKSEYIEARNIQNQILQMLPATHNLYHEGSALANISEVEISMGVSKNVIQPKIDSCKIIVKAHAILSTACDMIQADLNLREGNMSDLLFCQCLRRAWGRYSEAVNYCLERLGDQSRWDESYHPSSWTTVFLVNSLRTKQRLQVYKALQFLGDVFLKETEEATSISLFTLALEGFTEMDVHRSRAECMIRLGDISKGSTDLLKALELWETARPLFERSSQVKRVQDIDERLAGINDEVKEQHRINLRQLAELNAPMGKAGGVKEDLSDTGSEKGYNGLVVVA